MEVSLVPASEWLSGFRFLEGPRWKNGNLWVSDIRKNTVYAIDEAGNQRVVVEIRGLPSGLGFLPGDTLLVASMTDREILRVSNGTIEKHADLKSLAAIEINDMVVNANGWAFVGGYDFDLFAGQAPKPAKILSVAPDGSSTCAADNLAFPNGMVLMDGGARLVVAETFAHRLTSFDVETDGSLSNRQVFAQFEELHPDGICLDIEGGVWVSSFSRGHFIRVLEGGKITHRVEFPGRHAVACQLGGRKGKTLYCLTTEGTLEDIAKGRSKSSIMVADVAIAGAGSP